jgi:protein-disulfide isomerase
MKYIIASLFFAALVQGATDAPSITPGKASGSPGAPITIEVFSDFQCPSCKALYEETLQPLMNDYVATGKVYLVHRDFPLQMHSHSKEAAIWAGAAARVNPSKYEQVCSALFRQQVSWANDGKIENVMATVLNADEMKKARALLADKRVSGEMEQDMALGNQRKVTQTPTMFVNNKGRTYPVTGSVSYQILRKFLDDLLSR